MCILVWVAVGLGAVVGTILAILATRHLPSNKK